ncbi:MAG: cytochrome C biogenesis protein, partial [Calditrichaeota bacterium]|nr:cytochrome C biogenesis protein [Calditrichota bacterium]
MKIAGMLLISLAFIGSLTATLNYFYYIKSGSESYLKRANRLHQLIFAILLIVGILLYYSILVHDFSLNYVANYSSKNDPWYYQFAAFWAGQEGTFYLWTLYTTIFGLILIRRNDKFLPYVMIMLHISIFSILLILLKQSPFRPIDPAILANLTDGRGLNPLLKNYWMIIHPPTLFLG